MKKSLFFVALLLSGAASAQSSSSSASPNGAGAGNSGNDGDRVVCRSIRETGSMLSRTRICKTRAQWEEERRTNRQTIDRAQTNRALSGN